MALTVRGCPGAPRGVAPRSDPVANHHSQQPTYPSNPHHLKSPNTHHQTQTYPAHHPQPAGIWTPPYHLPGNSRRSSHHRDTAPLRGGGLSAPLPEGGQGLAPGHDSLNGACHRACHTPLLCSPSTPLPVPTQGHDGPNNAGHGAHHRA